jgi:hypothetical protein
VCDRDSKATINLTGRTVLLQLQDLALEWRDWPGGFLTAEHHRTYSSERRPSY